MREVEPGGFFLVTNNPQVARKFRQLAVEIVEGSVLDLLIGVRDYVHQGHRLITHPLSSSLKPGAIPYKTVLVSSEKHTVDQFSLQLIESSIEAYYKTVQSKPGRWNKQVLEDYAAVDISHLEEALASLGF